VPAEHLGALRLGPGHKLARQPRFADAGLAYHQHTLCLPALHLLKARDQVTESRGPSDEWSDQLAWWLALHAGHDATGRSAPVTSRRGGANALRQSHRLWRRWDLQLLGRARREGG